jgi:hypothetical protein
MGDATATPVTRSEPDTSGDPTRVDRLCDELPQLPTGDVLALEQCASTELRERIDRAERGPLGNCRDPWLELSRRVLGGDVEFWYADLDCGGMMTVEHGRIVILVDRNKPIYEMALAIAHELTHADRLHRIPRVPDGRWVAEEEAIVNATALWQYDLDDWAVRSYADRRCVPGPTAPHRAGSGRER